MAALMTDTAPARSALLERLVTKAGGVRSEATIQSDVRMLLLDPELGLAEEDLDVQLDGAAGGLHELRNSQPDPVHPPRPAPQ